MARRKLTEHAVRALQPKPRRYQLNEDNLQIEVNPSGLKTWFCYGRQDGRAFKKRLGVYPEVSVRAAREAVIELLAGRAKGRRVVEGTETFSGFLEGPFKAWCLANRKDGAATLARLRHQFGGRFGSTKMRAIRPEDVEQWKADALKVQVPATVKRNLGDLSKVFRLAVEYRLLHEAPTSSVKRPRVDRKATNLMLTDAQAARLRNALDAWTYRSLFGSGSEQQSHPRYFPVLVRLAMNTGMRKGEVLSLRWGDINPVRKLIRVRGVTTKTGATREIPINEALLGALKDWLALAELPETEGEVVDLDSESVRDLEVFQVGDIKRPWSRLKKMARLERVRFHDLRHHFASTLVRRGVALTVVQRLLGHTDLATTQIYLSVLKEDEFEAVNLLNE